MFRKLIEILLIIRWPFMLALTLLTLAGIFVSGRLRIDPTVETLFEKNSPEYRYYREYSERYGSDHIIAVAMSTRDVFTPDNLKVLIELHETFEAFPQVQRVLSLASAVDIRHKFMGVRLVPALEGAFEGSVSLDGVRRSILSNELYKNNLVSGDGKTANFLIRLKPERPGVSFVQQIRPLLEKYEKDGRNFYIAGSPVEQYDFVRLIRQDQFIFVPMITLLLVITTFLIYRSIPCVILAMSVVLTTLIWTFGSIALLGRELNLVTSLLAPVIMIIAVVDAIHFMNLFFEIRTVHASLRKSILLTMEQLWVPTFLTHLTTILGFLSLALSPVPAIHSFGLFAAMGTFFAYVSITVLVPVLLPTLPYPIRAEAREDGHFFNRVMISFLERLEYRWKWLIITAVAGCIVFSVLGIQRLNIDTNIVKQLRADSDLAVATRFIDEHLTGVYSLGFVIEPRGGRSLREPEVLERIDAFKEFLESLPQITNANSITTLIKQIHHAREGESWAYSIPEDRETLEQYFRGIEASNDPEVWNLVSRDFRETRIQARMRAVGTKDGTRMEQQARDYIEEYLSPYFKVTLTGNVVLLGKMSKDLVNNQIKSFASAFFSILVIISLIFRSLRLGLLVAIPNLLPIIMVYGFMGFAGIELSTSTAMISSIVLGLVVDASIHFLHRFRHEFEMRGHYLQALHHTYRNVGRALSLSTLILVAGFATSFFAAFRPTVHFGLLTSMTIFLALLSTLLVLPVLVLMMRPFGRQRLFTDQPPRHRH